MMVQTQWPPEGYEEVWLEADKMKWQLGDFCGHKCRWIVNGHKACGTPAVARILRSNGWWYYCADHLYGKRISAGRIEEAVLRKRQMMALTEAEQKHLAMVREQMALAIYPHVFPCGKWGYYDSWDTVCYSVADAILALKGKDGKRLVAVMHPEQLVKLPRALSESELRLHYELMLAMKEQGWVRTLEVKP